MEIPKDLPSLRSLYRILHTTANDMDDGARLLFKNLLDAARDNLLLPSSKEVSERNRKKRCQVCQQGKISNGDQTPSDFSKQVSDSIKLVESTILSLQLSSDILNPMQVQSSKLLSPHNPQSNQSPAYHYVHGLRLPWIPDDDGTRIATFRKNIDKEYGVISGQNEYLYTTHNHKKNPVKPTLLDYESPIKLPDGGQHKKATLSHQQESDVQSAMSSSTSSYSSRSRPETKTETEMTSETSTGENSSVYSSVESYDNTGSRRKMHSNNPDKTIGRLRRFKDKLGLIFHHHHNHHHLHHNGENVQSSMWKHLGKIFHHKAQQRIYEKNAAGKLKKLAGGKKQTEQIQALVKGMVRHVKHSKKSKLSKGGLKPCHDEKHWWQMFQHGRGRRPGAAKLPKGGRIKLQFKSKKPKLRVLRN